MRIQNNLAAINSHRQLGVTTRNIGVNTEKLSSGFRVNRAADDAAGLAISEKMRTQIRGLNRATLNIQDGVSLLQVGDGALQSIHDKMQRLRELAVQAANDTNQLIDREAIQLEFGQLTSEVNSVVQMTNFNGRLLFDGSIGASWEYNLGRVTTPFTTTIPAAGEFNSPANVTGWNVPAGFGTTATTPGFAGSSYTFPVDGVFAVQIQTPVNGIFNVVLDFEKLNSPPGSMTGADFEEFFLTEFNRLSQEHFKENIIESVRIVSNRIEIGFPNDGGVLTGIMGHPPASVPVPIAALPRVIIGANDLTSLNTPTGGQIISNRPAGSTPLIASDIKNSDVLLSAAPTTSMLTSPAGGFPTATINIDGTPTTIRFMPGRYDSIEDFIEKNRSVFENATPRSFTIDIADGKLAIKTKSLEEINPLTVAISITPTALASALGYGSIGSITSEIEEGEFLPIQAGANQDDIVKIEIPNLSTRSLGLSIQRPKDDGNPTSEGYSHINGLGAGGYTDIANVTGDPMEHSLDVTSHDKAAHALSVLTNAINIISTERARMGAQQNRLEFAMRNVDNTSENLQAAESRIRDVDMAAEMTMFVKNQILQQSGTAMLAQANILPQGMLQLLG